VKKGEESAGIETEGAGASRLDTETGLAPVSSLGVVPESLSVVIHCVARHRSWNFVQKARPRRGVGRQIVPDGVAGPQANPLGDGAVLLLRAGKLLLGAE
jgi:hypothetical protein